MNVFFQLVVFVVGLLFGRFWFGAIMLPVIYGIPRSVMWVFRGRILPRAILFYASSAILWSIVFLALAVATLVFSPDLARFLATNQALTIGQICGIGLGIAQMVSKQGRRDLDSDFRRGVRQYAKGKMPGSELKEFFLAALASYFLFDDRAAGHAAVLAAVTSSNEERDEMLAILLAIAQAPDTVALLFASASSQPMRSGLTTQRLRAHAEDLSAQIVSFDGNTDASRQVLAAEARLYERALRTSGKPNLAVFSKVDEAAIHRLSQLYS
jgi:hypothetical protein